jgi:hypothetical protein
VAIIVFDVDGTLADDTARAQAEGPWIVGNNTNEQWERYYALSPFDPPKPGVCELVRILDAGGHTIVFATGRPERFADATHTWLNDNVGISGWRLFMRREGDRRRNPIVKREQFDLIAEAYGEAPALWIDDHDELHQRDALPCPVVPISHKIAHWHLEATHGHGAAT